MAVYLEEAATRVARPDSLRYLWGKGMQKHFAHLLPEEVTRDVCKTWIAKRRNQGLSNATTRKELATLQAALNRTLGKANPAVVEYPPAPPARERYLDRDEVQALIDACGSEHVRLFIVLAIATGARGGAILDLTWDRVDLRLRTIDFGEGRGKKRRPVSKINKDAHAALVEAREAAICPYVINYEGQQVASIRKAFGRAAERAGLPGVTPHTLRHTAVTWMVMAGVPTTEVARAVGLTEGMVERVYGHHHPDFLSRAARATER